MGTGARTAMPALSLVAVTACSEDGATTSVLRVPADHATIQDAVDTASLGDLVLVAPGTYRERVVVETPAITILGEDRNEFVLDGDDRLLDGIVVTADGVAVENLTVQRYRRNGVLVNGASSARDLPEGGVYGALDASPVGYRIARDTLDLYYELRVDGPSTFDNCFIGNDFMSSSPPEIERPLPCDGVLSAFEPNEPGPGRVLRRTGSEGPGTGRSRRGWMRTSPNCTEVRGAVMRAHPGDQILIRGHHVGEHERKGEIIEVHGDDGGPPYLIRWDDDGHESLMFPGSDAVIEHLESAD